MTPLSAQSIAERLQQLITWSHRAQGDIGQLRADLGRQEAAIRTILARLDDLERWSHIHPFQEPREMP